MTSSVRPILNFVIHETPVYNIHGGTNFVFSPVVTHLTYTGVNSILSLCVSTEAGFIIDKLLIILSSVHMYVDILIHYETDHTFSFITTFGSGDLSFFTAVPCLINTII